METNPEHIPRNLGQQLVMEQRLPFSTVRDWYHEWNSLGNTY